MEKNVWVESSYSSDSANCVMICDTGDDIKAGDNKMDNWQSPENTLRFSREAFATFLGEVAAGRFDLPEA